MNGQAKKTGVLIAVSRVGNKWKVYVGGVFWFFTYEDEELKDLTS
jgi:hypothetical protein